MFYNIRVVLLRGEPLNDDRQNYFRILRVMITDLLVVAQQQQCCCVEGCHFPWDNCPNDGCEEPNKHICTLGIWILRRWCMNVHSFVVLFERDFLDFCFHSLFIFFIVCFSRRWTVNREMSPSNEGTNEQKWKTWKARSRSKKQGCHLARYMAKIFKKGS